LDLPGPSVVDLRAVGAVRWRAVLRMHEGKRCIAEGRGVSD
jgi:hypothetical protein